MLPESALALFPLVCSSPLSCLPLSYLCCFNRKSTAQEEVRDLAGKGANPLGDIAFFDDWHEEIVLFKLQRASKEKPAHAQLYISKRAERTWATQPNVLPLTEEEQDEIVGARLSPCRTYVAITIAHKVVKIFDLMTGDLLITNSVQDGKQVRMLAVYWVASSPCQLLFVTNQGVELYTLRGKVLAHNKPTVKHSTRHHWFLSHYNILILADRLNSFNAYHVANRSITRTCKFRLDCSGTSIDDVYGANDFDSSQFSVASIYGHITYLFVHEQKGQLHLLGIHPKKGIMEQTHVFDLFSPGKYAISFIDNVIVAYNTQAGIAMLFDIRSDPKSMLVSPLPLQGVRKLHEQQSWRFLGDRLLLECSIASKQGFLFVVDLDFEQIAASWPASKVPMLIDFLLKRSTVHCHRICLDLLCRLIVDEYHLSAMSGLFSVLNRIAYDAKLELHYKQGVAAGKAVAQPVVNSDPYTPVPIELPPSLDGELAVKNQQGYVVTRQYQLYNRVFLPAASRCSASHLIPYVAEFMRSIYRHFLKTEPFLNEFLAGLLMDDAQYFKFHQYLQYHILNDSTPVAMRLIELGRPLSGVPSLYPPAYQLGLDMLFRLKETTMLLLTLLSRAVILPCLKLVSPTSDCFAVPGLLPRDFLRAAEESSDLITFHTTYNFFQTR